MLDPVIEALLAELLKRFPADRSYPLKQISSSELPPTVRDRVASLLETHVRDDLESVDVTRLKWVDGGQEEVSSAFERLAVSALQHAHIPADQWADVLEAAVADVAAGIGDPARALVKHVFAEDQDVLSIESILSRVRSFAGLQSLRDAVYDSASRRNVTELSSDRFESLVTKVDALRSEGYNAGDWLDDLVPLSDLFDEVGLGPELPATFVASFLTARGLEQEGKALFECGMQNVSLHHARTIVTELPEDADDAAGVTASIEPAVAKEESGDGAVPLWRKYQKNLNAPYETTTSAVDRPAVAATADTKRDPVAIVGTEKPTPTHRNENSDGTRQPLWQRFRLTPRQTTTSARDVHDLKRDMPDLEREVLGDKGIKHRDTFITHLFDGAEEEYLAIVTDLHAARNWSEASRVIAEDVFKRRQINIYSESAVAFTNAVEARFRSRGVSA